MEGISEIKFNFLTELFLYSNEIESIEPLIRVHMPKLQTLLLSMTSVDVDWNKIMSIRTLNLSYWPQLKIVQFRNIQLIQRVTKFEKCKLWGKCSQRRSTTLPLVTKVMESGLSLLMKLESKLAFQIIFYMSNEFVLKQHNIKSKDSLQIKNFMMMDRFFIFLYFILIHVHQHVFILFPFCVLYSTVKIPSTL